MGFHFESCHSNVALARFASLALLSVLLAAAPEANARKLAWEGTLEIDVGFGDVLLFPGTGVATINNSSGGFHLTTLRLAGGITGSATIPITDPDTTGTIPSVKVFATLGSASLSPFYPAAQPQLNNNALPIKGGIRLCLFTPGCGSSLLLPLTAGSGETGVGIGGTVTAGGFGAVRISLAGSPWTPRTARISTATPGGGAWVVEETGFLHGISSFSTTAATTGGVIQLVSPMLIRSSQNAEPFLAINTLTLRFVPEPGFLLLFSAGSLGLLILRRNAKSN